jgi:hypothetical protein
MSNLTVTNSSASSMRDCCNSTFQTIGNGLKKFSTWVGAGAVKVAEAVKPYLQKLAAAIMLAGSIAWNNTKVFFINHKKELALVGLGAAIVVGVVALVKGIQFCCNMNKVDAGKGKGADASKGADAGKDAGVGADDKDNVDGQKDVNTPENIAHPQPDDVHASEGEGSEVEGVDSDSEI